MDTATSSADPGPGPDWPRPSLLRFALRGLLALAALAVLVTGFAYHGQIWAKLTHLVGSPEHNIPFEPLSDADHPDLRLAVAGDVGDGGDLAWRLAATMYVAGRHDPFDALILLGDNVYPSGDVARLDEYVFRPFAAVLDSGADLYAIAGNHDALADDGGVAQLRALGMPGLRWSEQVGDLLLVGLDGNRPDDRDQREWLEGVLASSDAAWKIVTVHQPPYSAGYQGSDRAVREAFTSLFARHGVQLVLSGHDHDYQRSVPIGGVTYVISGGGSGTRRTGAADYTAYSAAVVNFVDLNVYADHLLLRAIDHELMVFDEFTIPR